MTKEKWSLNRTQIKYIAITSMLIDHTAAFFLTPDKHPALTALYIIMRTVGRIAGPVMFFSLVEGYIHTSSRLRYGLRLLGFGIISQIPYSLARYGILSLKSLNVIVTLFLSYVILYEIDNVKNQISKWMIIVFIILLTAFSDWGLIGPVMVLFFYTYRDDKRKQIGAYLVINGIHLASSIAIVVQDTGKWYDAVMQMGLIIVMPILKSYNREAGRKTLINKWVFYLLYPFHLLLFWLILKS